MTGPEEETRTGAGPGAEARTGARSGAEARIGTGPGAEARTGTADERTAGVEERRLHPVTPFRRAWAPVALVAGVAMQNPERIQEWGVGLSSGKGALIVAAAVPAAALYGFLSWWFTHFAVTDTELRIRTGLLFRRTAHIRLDRLQAVDVTQPLLGRIAGVAKLKLDVVGTEDKDELAFLGEREARSLRAELLARAAGFAPAEAAQVGEAPVRELLRVQPRQLALSLVLSLSVVASVVAGLVAPFVVLRFTGSVWTALVVLLPILGGAWAASAGRFLAEYDWTVAESPDGLRLDHGLLDRAHETVPPGRVQMVRLVEPLLWRRRGWVRVELAVAGSKNGLLVPVAPREAAEAVVARVLPGVDLGALAFTAPPGRRARWVVPVWWKGYGLAVSPEVFAVRHGRLCRRTELVPHAKVQSVRLTQGPWERARDVADVHVDHGANGTVTARLRGSAEAAGVLAAQAARSRTGRLTAGPERWMT
ncbi:PH domain-containing protein [Streptomyces sp. NPDC086023]|uniref:PH domain-containing protein n=1 Tax=Streptomyces sp. NPDC086023 TaxID=3365746 RepID=UPI0037D826B6